MLGDLAIIAVFALSNVLRLLAYVPQMLCIHRDRNGATSTSCTSWALFGVSHAATALYALFLSSDVWLALFFAANAVCCGLIVGMTAMKRRQAGRAQTPGRPDGPENAAARSPV